MGIHDDIQQMDNVVRQLVIEKFLNIDIVKQKSNLSEDVIQTEVILKERVTDEKIGRDKQSSIKYKITKSKIEISLVDTAWFGTYDKSDTIRLKIDINTREKHHFSFYQMRKKNSKIK